jgi:HEAT repeat protein/energy-coupling factor transporter ATP-binding protein EcfA2
MVIVILVYIASETVLSILKGSGLWLAGKVFNSILSLWKEQVFLYQTIKDARFVQWKPKSKKFVTLKAVRAQEEGLFKTAEPLIIMLKNYLRKGESLLILGEPGAGKTTVLEAFNYQLARTAYRWNTFAWLFLEFVAIILIFWSPAGLLIWLIAFPITVKFLHPWKIPIFLELRAFFESDIHNYFEKEIKERLGDTNLLNIKGRLLLLLDGTNEINQNNYAQFIEGWNQQKKTKNQTYLTSRLDEKPNVKGVITIIVCELDDKGVKSYAQVYTREKKKQGIQGGHNNSDITSNGVFENEIENYFEDLKQKGLLEKNGIGRNPYWLRMLVLSNLSTRNRGRLLLSFIKELILREIEVKPQRREHNPAWNIVQYDVEMEALAKLALAMSGYGKVGLEGATEWQRSIELIQKTLDVGGCHGKPMDILYEAESATLLRFKYKSQIYFSHNLVQEFFTAFALRSELSWDEALAHSDNSWWWETIFLLGSLLTIPEITNTPNAWDKFIRKALSLGKDHKHLLLTMGLLQSSENPVLDTLRFALEQIALSIKNVITPSIQQAVWDLERIIKEEAVEIFGTLFNDSNLDLKSAGATLLCISNQLPSRETLLSSLRKPDDGKVTFRILSSIKPPPLDLLIFALSEKELDMQLNAVEALKNIGGEKVVDALKESLLEKTNLVRSQIIIALGEIGNDNVIDALESCIWDVDDKVGAQAVSAIIKIGSEKAIKVLASALGLSTEKRKFVTRTVLETLKKSGNEQSVRMLLMILRDPFLNRDMYSLFTKEFVDIGNQFVIKELKKALFDPDSMIRSVVTDALIKINKDIAVDAIGFVFRSENENDAVHSDAFNALIKIAGKRVLDIFHSALKDTNDRVRSQALRALGDIGNSDVIDSIILILENNNELETVRNEAATALGKIGDIRAVAHLIPMLEDEKVCANAALALGKIGSPQAIPELISILKNQDSRIRLQVIIALGEIGSEDALDALKNILSGRSQRDESLFRDTAMALVKIGTNRAFDVLLFALKADNIDVRVQVAEALGELNNPYNIEGLSFALEDVNEMVRSKAAFALGQIGDPSAFNALKFAYNHETSETAATSEGQALVRIDRERALEMWITQLQNTTGQSLIKAIKGLGWLDDIRSFKSLVIALQEKSPDDVRAEAAKSIKIFGSPRADEELIKALHDKNELISLQMIKILGTIKDDKSIQALMHVLQDDNTTIRRRSAEELGKAGKVESVEQLLITLSIEEDFQVRGQIVKALGEICINDERVSGKVYDSITDNLRDALHDNNPRVRFYAVEALGKIGDAKAISCIGERSLYDRNEDVRLAAIEILKNKSDRSAGLLAKDRSRGVRNIYQRPRTYSDLQNWDKRLW